jgi:MarR family transcriptional regulator for hemolysin
MSTTAMPAARNRAFPDLSFLLAHTSHVLTTRLTAVLAEIGMTVRGHCVLMHALPGDLTQIELAKLTDLDKTTMVVTLDELEEAGLAQRRPSPADRRARIVVVTEEGQRIAAVGEQLVDPTSGKPSPARSAGWSAATWPTPRTASGRSGGHGKPAGRPVKDCLQQNHLLRF